jgi:hypothetical protein
MNPAKRVSIMDSLKRAIALLSENQNDAAKYLLGDLLDDLDTKRGPSK